MVLFGLCGVSNKQTDLLDNSYYFHKGGCVSLSLPQPMYTVSLWHSWVGNARGGPCMNCSFRRWNWSFLPKLCVTINGDCSLWNLMLVHLSTTEVEVPFRTNVIWNTDTFSSLSICQCMLISAKSYVSQWLIPILCWQLYLSNSDFPVKPNISTYSKRARLSWIHTEQFENQVSVSVQKWLTYFEI